MIKSLTLKNFKSIENGGFLINTMGGGSKEKMKAESDYHFKGKKILFKNQDSLFQRLKKLDPELNFSKETIAAIMFETEIHKDITLFLRN